MLLWIVLAVMPGIQPYVRIRTCSCLFQSSSESIWPPNGPWLYIAYLQKQRCSPVKGAAAWIVINAWDIDCALNWLRSKLQVSSQTVKGSKQIDKRFLRFAVGKKPYWSINQQFSSCRWTVHVWHFKTLEWLETLTSCVPNDALCTYTLYGWIQGA